MMKTEKEKSIQKIYAFEDKRYPGWIKIGMSSRNPEIRVREQYATVIPYGEMPYNILCEIPAVKNNGELFSDHNVHDMLSAKGFLRGYSEWFRCTLNDIYKAIDDIKTGKYPNDYIEK